MNVEKIAARLAAGEDEQAEAVPAPSASTRLSKALWGVIAPEESVGDCVEAFVQALRDLAASAAADGLDVEVYALMEEQADLVADALAPVIPKVRKLDKHIADQL